MAIGEDIGTHSTELAKEKRDKPLCAEDINTQSNNKQEEPVAAEDATTTRKVEYLNLRHLFNGETSTPSPGNGDVDNAEHGGDGRAAGISSHPSETDKGKGKMPMHLPKLLADAMKSINPLNSRPLVLPSQKANLSRNDSLYGVNRAPATFTYYDPQKGVGMLNPMGPFPMQQPKSLSAELMPSSMWMRNRGRNQPQGGVMIREQEEALDDDDEELDLELRL